MTNSQYLDDKGTLTNLGYTRVAMGLAILQDAVRANNFEKGWRAEGNPQRNVGELTSLLHSEVSECFEAHRNNEPALWFEHTPAPGFKTNAHDPHALDPALPNGTLGKPEGMAAELADVIIRVLDMADELGLPVVEAVIQKHAYNQTRPYRHGGKAC